MDQVSRPGQKAFLRVTPQSALWARQTALSMSFCFQRDRVFGHYDIVLFGRLRPYASRRFGRRTNRSVVPPGRSHQRTSFSRSSPKGHQRENFTTAKFWRTTSTSDTRQANKRRNCHSKFHT
jgi:hypothetical protein